MLLAFDGTHVEAGRGTTEICRAFRKCRRPQQLLDRITLDLTGSIWYPIVTVALGPKTKEQKFRIALDTGSTLFFVPKTGSTTDPLIKKYVKTVTYKQIHDERLCCHYLDGARIENGIMSEEIIQLGPLKRLNTEFVLAKTIKSGQFDSQFFDGIAGVPSKQSAGSLFPAILDVFKSKKMSFYYKHGLSMMDLTENPNQLTGNVDLGEPDGTKGLLADTKWLDVVPHFQNLWNVSLNAIEMGETKVALHHPYVLADTGCNYSRFTKQLYDGLLNSLGLSRDMMRRPGSILIPCRSIPDVNFKFHFGQVLITVPARQMFAPLNSNICVLAVQEDDMNILGTGFLRNFYTTFDFETKRVGLAPMIH